MFIHQKFESNTLYPPHAPYSAEDKGAGSFGQYSIYKIRHDQLTVWSYL